MACVLVHTEVVDGRPTPMALAILGEGRRIASSLGGALYAVAWVAPGADVGTPAQELAAALGGGGADRVVLVAGPPRPARRGPPPGRGAYLDPCATGDDCASTQCELEANGQPDGSTTSRVCRDVCCLDSDCPSSERCAPAPDNPRVLRCVPK